jgi:hypothetical protein
MADMNGEDTVAEPAIFLDGGSVEGRGAGQVARDLISSGEAGISAATWMLEALFDQLDGCEGDDAVRKLGLILLSLLSHAIAIGRVGDELGEKDPGWTLREGLRRHGEIPAGF